MATLLLQRIRPMNRKQRLLEYLKSQENATLEIKASNKQIEKEIEAVFEELVAEPDNAIYISDMMEETDEIDTEKVYDGYPEILKQSLDNPTATSPIAKNINLFESEFEKYSDKFDSVVETANMLHQQLQDATNDGIIILCEDTDVSYDYFKTIVAREERSPIPQNKKKRRRLTAKPVKKILHITGDSTLEYFDDCQTMYDVEAIEYEENSPNQEKKKKPRRRISKNSDEDFVHITGDSSPNDFDNRQSTPKFSSNTTSETDTEAEFSPTRSSVAYPYESPSNPDHVVIGPNETIVNKHDFKKIDWDLSAPIVTRKLLLHIFGRDILSTHSLTGKPSPAFLDQKKPLKKPLDAKKVADIIYIVTNKKDVKPKEVRLTITSKCADEQKMRKVRLSK